MNTEKELTEEQRLVQKMARDFAKEKVLPLAKKIDAEHYFPKELIPELGKLGFLGVCTPSEYGGAELDYVSYALIIEELAKACASTSVIVSAHNSLCIAPILASGTEAQKKKYLPKLASGEALGCFALSEPGTGSDAAHLTCIAKKSDKGWVINGVKNWITNGPEATYCVLFAMHAPELKHKGITAFVVNLKETKGVSIGKHEDKLGICGSPTSSLMFDNVLLQPEEQLGKEGEGFSIAMKTLDGGRLGIAAQAVGIAAACLSDSVRYAKERKAFGKIIGEHQSIQNYLADMSCRIDAARLMTIHGSKLKDAGLSYGREAAQAKLFSSEAAMWSANKAIQIHGGYGYVKEFNVERYYRDAKITEIYEGTSEIQRLVIASHLLKEDS